MTTQVTLAVDDGPRFDIALGDAWTAVDLDDPQIEERLARMIGAVLPVEADEDAVDALEALADLAGLLRASSDRLPDPAQRFVLVDVAHADLPPTLMVMGIAVATTDDVPAPEAVAETWWATLAGEGADSLVVDRLEQDDVTSIVLRERVPDTEDWDEHVAAGAVWIADAPPLFFDLLARGPFAHLAADVIEPATLSVECRPGPAPRPAEDAP